MAQDPEQQQGGQNSEDVKVSHGLDMVTLFRSQDLSGELDADNIRGVLESSGIASVIESTPYNLVLGIEVRVARQDLERAKSVIAAALAAGPEAAAEAEAQSETEKPR